MYSKKVNAEKIQEARNNFPKIIKKTPLEFSERLSKKYGGNIYLKREDQQKIRSYKIRGAFNAINSLTPEQQKKGVVCASAGNHAQGVAITCNNLKIKGYVFMPKVTPSQKIERTKSFGGKYVEVVLQGDTFDEAQKGAMNFCKRKKMSYIAPFDDVSTIVGAGTIGMEIVEQMEEIGKQVDMVIVPIGGGGLISGVSAYLKEINPKVKIIGVEAEGSAGMTASLQAGKVIELPEVNTFADGVAVKRVGRITFNLTKENVDKINVVPEDRIPGTILKLLKEEGVILEPAGALSINTLRDFSRKELNGKNVICILSGGNFDFDRLPDIKERYLIYKGLKKHFTLNLPHRPGALKEFLNCLGPDDNIVYIHYSTSNEQWGNVRIGIQTSKKANFNKIFQAIKKTGMKLVEVGKYHE